MYFVSVQLLIIILNNITVLVRKLVVILKTMCNEWFPNDIPLKERRERSSIGGWLALTSSFHPHMKWMRQ